jgi:hypothetical protein
MPTTIENECVIATENIIQDGVVNAGTEIEIKAPEKCSSWQSELSVSRMKLFHLIPIFFGQIKTSIIDYASVFFCHSLASKKIVSVNFSIHPSASTARVKEKLCEGESLKRN